MIPSGWKSSMRKFLLQISAFGILAVAIFAGVLLSSAGAHEAHQMRCTQVSIDTIRADIQAMKDGEAKRTATKEMKMAEGMMVSKDREGCVAHMHNAMEAIEE